MAKRSRIRDPIDDSSRPQPAGQATRGGRRARPARRQQASILERYGGLLVVGLGGLGVLLIFFLLFQGGARGAYECETLLTPGPVETTSPRPVTPSPVTSPSPSPDASPGESPAASPAESPATSPAESPAESPVAGAPSPEPSPSPTASESPAPDPTPRLGFTTVDLGRSHVRDPGETLEYGFCPPTSGDHWAITNVGPIRAGFYPSTQEQAPGGWVHNLEHGYVVALYRCTSDQDCPSQAELDRLRQFTEQAPASTVNPNCASKVIAARFDSIDTRFALLAWGRALLMDEFDLDTALTFAEQWIDHEAVPERGVCP